MDLIQPLISSLNPLIHSSYLKDRSWLRPNLHQEASLHLTITMIIKIIRCLLNLLEGPVFSKKSPLVAVLQEVESKKCPHQGRQLSHLHREVRNSLKLTSLPRNHWLNRNNNHKNSHRKQNKHLKLSSNQPPNRRHNNNNKRSHTNLQHLSLQSNNHPNQSLKKETRLPPLGILSSLKVNLLKRKLRCTLGTKSGNFPSLRDTESPQALR